MDTKLNELYDNLERSIDAMDMNSIEELLQKIEREEEFSIKAEDSRIFAKKIENIYKTRRNNNMNKNKIKYFGIIAASVAVLATAGVCANQIINNYSFSTKDKAINIMSNSELDDEELDQLLEDVNKPVDEETNYADENGGNVITPEELTFSTIEEAEAKTGVKIILPKIMPELDIESIKGSASNTDKGYSNNTVWLEYGNPEEKYFGITVSRTILPKDGTVISSNEVDDDSAGSYTSKNGTKYETYNESNPDGSMTANIAVAYSGEYEYALVFVNFEETEIHNIIDSIELDY